MRTYNDKNFLEPFNCPFSHLLIYHIDLIIPVLVLSRYFHIRVDLCNFRNLYVYCRHYKLLHVVHTCNFIHKKCSFVSLHFRNIDYSDFFLVISVPVKGNVYILIVRAIKMIYFRILDNNLHVHGSPTILTNVQT